MKYINPHRFRLKLSDAGDIELLAYDRKQAIELGYREHPDDFVRICKEC